MKLSICIPTFNRAAHLSNCLQSIASASARSNYEVQICVSDNCSTDGTESVVLAAERRLKLKYRKNPRNLGMAKNFLSAVQMADGEFVWLIGDDDLLFPHALEALDILFESNPNVDYFFVNSCHLTTEYVFSFPQPFSVSNLPGKMDLFSSWSASGRMKFMDLVDPKISFDFLLGVYLAVFRRENWVSSADVIDEAAASDERVFSSFENTCPHVKIFARAFSKSDAYFCAEPLSICLSGAREWAPMYPLVRSVRMIEALEEYRKNGLPYFRFLKCKNFALGFFVPDLVNMFINRTRSGFDYIHPLRLIAANFVFPNFYLSVVYYLVRKLRRVFAGRLPRFT